MHIIGWRSSISLTAARHNNFKLKISAHADHYEEEKKEEKERQIKFYYEGGQHSLYFTFIFKIIHFLSHMHTLLHPHHVGKLQEATQCHIIRAHMCDSFRCESVKWTLESEAHRKYGIIKWNEQINRKVWRAKERGRERKVRGKKRGTKKSKEE